MKTHIKYFSTSAVLVAAFIICFIWRFSAVDSPLQDASSTNKSSAADLHKRKAIFQKSEVAKHYKQRGNVNKSQPSFPERLDKISRLTPEEGKIEKTLHLLSEWGKQDFKSALEWLSSTTTTDGVGYYYHAIFIAALTDATHKDKAEIANLILELPSQLVSKGQIINDYIDFISKEDPISAMYWSENIAEDSLRDHAKHILIHDWAIDNPREVLDFLSTYSDVSSELSLYATDIAARRMVLDNPELEASSIYQYPEGIRKELAQSVIRHLVESNLEPNRKNAKLWLESIPEGEIKDKVLSQYIESSGTQAPLEEIFQLAMSINNSHSREQILSASFENWYAQSNEEAEYFLLNSYLLDEQQKTQILQQAKNAFSRPKDS